MLCESLTSASEYSSSSSIDRSMSKRLKPTDAKEILDLIMGAEDREKNPGKEKKPLDAITILSLPEHLRKTALVIQKIGRATAPMIAQETGRETAEENVNLEELVKRGYLAIEIQDDDTYYQI